ncbi:hypothetical protein Mapa_007627 [Marchantia paleacea]|nr:hypothetical protein Mapa_007627 [Marchantia paleacea]
MCSSDVFDLLVDFPLQLKTEPLDDLFDTEPKPILNRKLLETPTSFFSYDEEPTNSIPKSPVPMFNYEEEEAICSPKAPAHLLNYDGEDMKSCLKSPSPSLNSDGEQVKRSPKNSPEPRTPKAKSRSESLSPPAVSRSDSPKTSVLTTADGSALVGGPVYMKASKLHPYEDFHSFLIREGGIGRERLARLVSSQEYPRADEDFVSFLARSIGIKDEQYVTNLRQALRCEPIIEFGKSQVPVKMEVDYSKLEVGPDEDAVSFFVRAGSWESTSSVDEELASVGLDEDEDAESFLRRTGHLSSSGLEFESLKDSQFVPPGMSSFITAKEELEALKDQVLVQVSSPSETMKDEVLVQVTPPSTPEDMEGVVVNRKRRSSDSE